MKFIKFMELIKFMKFIKFMEFIKFMKLIKFIKDPKRNTNANFLGTKNMKTYGGNKTSKIGVLAGMDVTTSLVAKKHAFWHRRSPFWTHGDPFREHFHLFIFF